jgi:hypothetical protein
LIENKLFQQQVDMALKVKKSKRAALRFKLAEKPITYMANGQLGQAILQNISTSGCAVTKSSTQLTKNDQVLIVIELTECERPLELKARVMRAGDAAFSVQFTDLEESFVSHFSTMLATELRHCRSE